MQEVVKNYMQPAFLICVALLAIAGGGMSFAVKKFEMHLKKEPLPLKKSLEMLDEKDLSSYKVITKKKIHNKEVVEALGTKQYIQWILEDTDASPDNIISKCSLFITYYELPDKVPHVPEECYAGAGHQKLAGKDLELVIDKGGAKEHLAARQLDFSMNNPNYLVEDTKFSVFYILNVNGVYTNKRKDARIILNKNIFGKHSYFCKIEWNFLTSSGMRICPQKEQATAASEKLLSVILPVLEQEHWPDYDD